MEALVFAADPGSSAVLRGALADVGCLDIATVDLDDVDSYEGSRPALIVVDLDARDTLSVRRLVREFRPTPVVVICNEEVMDEAFAAGATGVVAKPLRPVELVARLRVALRGRAEEARRAMRERKLTDAMEQLQREKHDLERLVCVDSLTGIANRRHMLSLLDAEWRRSAREHLVLAVVMIDLDCYHAYNEQYGHLGGDSCLQRVAEAMVTCLRRPSDFLGRYGGEEFLAVLPNTDAAGAKIVAERLRAAVEALAIPHLGSACSHVVTITAGFAAAEVEREVAVDTLIGAADAALLRAKVSGRNRIAGEAPRTKRSRVSAQRWTRFAPVFTDPWFADRVPSYLADVRLDAESLPEALRVGELERIHRVARQLHVTAATYGFCEIDRMAGELAQAARMDDRRAIHTIAGELIEYVTHVQVIYRRPLESIAAGDAS
jgi:two-component system chemotaxis family response regulator WspR